jgi:hypothetical protein
MPWSLWQGPAELAAEWPRVEAYVDAVLADTEVLPRYLKREGQVHPVLCAGLASEYRIVQREAVIAFPNEADRRSAKC